MESGSCRVIKENRRLVSIGPRLSSHGEFFDNLQQFSTVYVSIGPRLSSHGETYPQKLSDLTILEPTFRALRENELQTISFNMCKNNLPMVFNTLSLSSAPGVFFATGALEKAIRDRFLNHN